MTVGNGNFCVTSERLRLLKLQIRNRKSLFVFVCTLTVVYCFVKVFFENTTTTTSSNKEMHGNRHNRNDDHVMCKFGIITDLQYADVSNGANYAKTRIRYHRNSLTQLSNAVSMWNQVQADFAIDLGDLLDGKSAKHNQTDKNLSKTLAIYQRFKRPVFFHWGNHFFYNFDRMKLTTMKEFNPHFYENVHTTNDRTSLYYHFSPHHGFRIVVLDVYEISMLGRGKDDNIYQKAEKILRSKNKNTDLNSRDGLHGDDLRYLKYNGALTVEQLTWLDKVLQNADENRERVLVTGHTPLYAPSSQRHCLPWNYESILKVLHRHPCVAAYFAGHDHDGGYAVDAEGIHHITFQGAIETTPGVDTYAVVYLRQSGLTIHGYGRVPTYHVPFNRKFL